MFQQVPDRFEISPDSFDAYAIYDQGSASLVQQFGGPPGWLVQLIQWYKVNLELSGFYIMFYAVFFSLIYLCMRRRKALKFLTNVIENIIEIRAVLRNEHTNKDIFSEV